MRGSEELQSAESIELRDQVRVVAFAPYYPPAFRAGGPVKSISSLVQAADGRFAVRVLTRNWDLGSRESLHGSPDRWLTTDEGTIWPWSSGFRRYLRALRAASRQRAQIVYVNSLFDPWLAIVPAVLWALGAMPRSTLVVAPRGQLADSALDKSARRKRGLLQLWRCVARRKSVVLHAATERERSDIARVLGPVNVLVRPNEVGPLLQHVGSFDRPQREHDELRTVFLGRLVPIKGLLDLLTSLRDVTLPMSLEVYGPEEDPHYAARCRVVAEVLPSHVHVAFRGPVPSHGVRDVLAGYDVMLNPTLGESFGQAIGEALSVGTPVAVGPVTPWTRWIEQASGGWIVRGDDWEELVRRAAVVDGPGWARLRSGARSAYEQWWHEAQSETHLFDKVLDRRH